MRRKQSIYLGIGENIIKYNKYKDLKWEDEPVEVFLNMEKNEKDKE